MNVVITGANRGIGLALTHAYIKRGDTVYALCRQASEDLKQSGANIVENVDMLNTDALPQCLVSLQKVSIDILINNAGVLERESLSDWNPATIEKQFKVNALAPLLVTQCLLPSMAANSKVVMITSRMGSMADNGSGGYYGYRMSKAALNAAGVSMAKDLASQGIAVALLHPGFVQTEMVNYGGDIDATTSALRLQQLIDDLNLANSGQFWHSNGESLPW